MRIVIWTDNCKKQGLTILLSEQNLFFAQELADSAILLDKGQISFKGSLSDLEQHQTLQTSN